MDPEQPDREGPVVTISRRTLRRVGLAIAAVVILAGVVVGAFLTGRTSGRSGTTRAASQAPASGVSRSALVTDARGYAEDELGGHEAAAYAFVLPSARKSCSMSAFRSLMSLAYLFGRGATVSVSKVHITGHRATVDDTVRFNKTTVSHRTSSEWVLAGSRWWINLGPSCVKSTTAPPSSSTITSSTTTTTTTTTRPPSTTTAGPAPGFTVLPPATVAPVAAECDIPVATSGDGNASPLLCPNGGVNVPAWKFYERISAPILALGRNASESLVVKTMCTAHLQTQDTYPEIENAGKLVGTYYGWSFANTSAITLFPFYPTVSSNECG
jgi:hypothetical protein